MKHARHPTFRSRERGRSSSYPALSRDPDDARITAITARLWKSAWPGTPATAASRSRQAEAALRDARRDIGGLRCHGRRRQSRIPRHARFRGRRRTRAAAPLHCARAVPANENPDNTPYTATAGAFLPEREGLRHEGAGARASDTVISWRPPHRALATQPRYVIEVFAAAARESLDRFCNFTPHHRRRLRPQSEYYRQAAGNVHQPVTSDDPDIRSTP